MNLHKTIKLAAIISGLLTIPLAYAGEVELDALSRIKTINNQLTNQIRVTHRHTYSKSGNRLSRIVEIPYREIRVQAEGAPALNISSGGIRTVGSTLELYTTPYSNTEFLGWFLSGVPLSSPSSLIFFYTIPADVPPITVITARFRWGVYPSILTPPASQLVDAGSLVTFTVTATGDNPITYQWYRNGTEIPGAASSSLALSAASVNDAGRYSVIVSNRFGAVQSYPNQLSIRTSGYDQWKSANFTPSELALNDPLVVGPNAILDGQASNLLHYALGISARNPIAGTINFEKNYDGLNEYFIYRYRHLLRGGGLNYTVAISDDLVTWDETESQVEHLGVPEPSFDGLTETVTVRLKSPISSARIKFFRLKVSQ